MKSTGGVRKKWMIEILVTIIGCIIIFAVIHMAINKDKFDETRTETRAVITGIKTFDTDDETEHEVYIDYYVGEEKYENVQLEYWKKAYHIGKEITVYYKTDYPYDVVTK